MNKTALLSTLAALGTSALLTGCSSPPEAKSPVSAKEVPAAGDKHDGAASCGAAMKTGAASCGGDKKAGAASCGGDKGAAQPASALTPAAGTPAATTTEKRDDKKAAPAKKPGSTPGASSCGNGTCSGKK